MGIGRELALCFAEIGANLAIADIDGAGVSRKRAYKPISDAWRVLNSCRRR